VLYGTARSFREFVNSNALSALHLVHHQIRLSLDLSLLAPVLTFPLSLHFLIHPLRC